MTTSSPSHVILQLITSPMTFAECALRIKSHITMQAVNKLPQGDIHQVAQLVTEYMTQPIEPDIQMNIQTLRYADVWSSVQSNCSQDDVCVFYVSQQSGAYAEQLYRAFIQPEQYPGIAKEAMYYRERYPHWQVFLAQQCEFFKKYSGQFFAVARAKSSYAQYLEDGVCYRICFDPHYAISFEQPFMLQSIGSSVTENTLEVVSFALQKRCIPVEYAKRLMAQILAKNGMMIQQSHSDLYEWLQHVSYASIPDATIAQALYPTIFVAVDMLQTEPESLVPIVPPAPTAHHADPVFTATQSPASSVATENNSSSLSPVGNSATQAHTTVNPPVPNLLPVEQGHAKTSDSPRTVLESLLDQLGSSVSQSNGVRTKCTLYQQDRKIGETDYLVSIQDPHTDQFYWMMVIEVNSMTPLVYDQIRTRVRPFHTTTSFADVTQKERIPFQMTHGIMLVADIYGIYVLRDGELVTECGVQKPLWRRTEFATLSITEMIRIISTYISPETRMSLPTTVVDDSKADEIQPIPSLPLPLPTEESHASNSSGCVINGMFVAGAILCWIVANGFNVTFFVCVLILFVIYRYTRTA